MCMFSEVEYQCLGTWKDGSDLYMYGGFSGPGITTKDDMYRCFVSRPKPHQALMLVDYFKVTLATSKDAC